MYSVKKSWKLSDLSEKNTPPANEIPVSNVRVITKFRNRCVFFLPVGGGTESTGLEVGGVGGVGETGATFAGADVGGAVWIFGPGFGGTSGTCVGEVGVVLLGVGGLVEVWAFVMVPADTTTVSAGATMVPAGAKENFEPGRFPGVFTSLDSSGEPGWGILIPAKNRCIFFDVERGGQPGSSIFFLQILSMAYMQPANDMEMVL